MQRREFITFVGGAVAAFPLAARAQQRAMSRIGVVMGLKENDPVAQAQITALREELQKLGWTATSQLTFDMLPMIETIYVRLPWS
ncbi:MAG TPA: hypothetical protein VKG63_17445 [Steroidobacteraceae bacterium]|nr:hypothetical protein [Steroidobacteraceae bacterium]